MGERKYSWIAIIISISRRHRGGYPDAQDTEQDVQVVGSKSSDVIAKRRGTVYSPQMWRKQESREGNAARLDIRKNLAFLSVSISIVKLPRMPLNLHLSFLTDVCLVDKGTFGPDFGRFFQSF